jgi:hypothetical protein
MQWYFGEDDEDHAAAVFFNITGAEYVADRPNSPPTVIALAELRRALGASAA